MTMSDKIVPSSFAETETLDTNDPAAPAVGKWYWVRDPNEKEQKPDLACVIHLGSNYVQLKNVFEQNSRIHLDAFWEQCEWVQDPDTYIDKEISRNQNEAKELLHRVRELTNRLAVSPNPTLPTSSETQALALHRSEPVTSYKAALIQARDKTIPQLFEEIRKANHCVAQWMKAKLIPLQAQADSMDSIMGSIKNRIFSVELYAGLVEKIKQVRDGEPSGLTEKIHLMQRRAYMDEECLAHYQTGGMDFKSIDEFDQWMSEQENFERILPFPRCIITFRVRRETKEREAVIFSDFIRIIDSEKLDKKTFLYIRNGDKLFRMSTEVEFGENLFPDLHRQQLSGKLWAEMFAGRVRGVITDNEYQGMLEEEAQKEKEIEKMPKADRWWRRVYKNSENYVHYSPESVYYDDISAFIGQEVSRHNRLVLILQGLLDRSPVFHPHPPWLLWTNEGFQQSLELVYDSSRSLQSGPPPDFEAYRAKLNRSLRQGSITVGQEVAWEISEAHRENDRLRNDYRNRSDYRHSRFRPLGDPGPGTLAQVAHWAPKSELCTYRWERERRGMSYYRNQDKVQSTFTCSAKCVLNVDAYVPGDFKQFFSDPRTRASYLQWAPLLLEAEEYHAGNRKVNFPIIIKKEKDPEASLRYQLRKKRRALLGKAVRLVSTVTTQGDETYAKDSLWRVISGQGDLFLIEGIDDDGVLEKSGRLVNGVHRRKFVVDPSIPGDPKFPTKKI